MSSQRLSLAELRSKIEAYHAHVASARAVPDHRRAMVMLTQAIGLKLDAWEAAYLWHYGVAKRLLAGFPLSSDGTKKDEYEALERERDEGVTLVRQRLHT